MGKPGAAIRAAGWVAVGAIAAGGVATAATTSGSSKGSSSAIPAATVPSTAPSTAPSTGAGKGKRAGRIAKLQGRLLHGEFTVEGKGGTPTNVAEQRGTVNAVSSTSITLTSKDGFNHTYVVGSGTRVRVDGKKGSITGVKTGQVATVFAKVNGSTETAALIVQRAPK
jgi:hypothetical protein